MSIGNKYLGKTVTAFALAGSLEYPMVVSINTEHAFTRPDKNICLPVTEVLLFASVGYLVQLKKLKDWALPDAVILPPLLTEEFILDRKTSVAELIKIFASKILERVSEAAYNTSESKGGDDLGEEDETTNKAEYGKAAAHQETDTISDYCDKVLAFFQYVAMKSPRVTAVPMSLHAGKRARDWFRRWSSHHITPPQQPLPSPRHTTTWGSRDS